MNSSAFATFSSANLCCINVLNNNDDDSNNIIFFTGVLTWITFG